MCAVASSSEPFLAERPTSGRRRYRVLLLLLGVVLSLGVALLYSMGRPSAPLTLYAVKGKVLVDGEPVENVNVAFHPLEEGKGLFCPVGRTDSKGVFHLTTRSNDDGAPAGEYSVTFVWPDGAIDECECIDPTLHDLLKGTYAKADQSTFHATVGSSGNTFWFNVRRIKAR